MQMKTTLRVLAVSAVCSACSSSGGGADNVRDAATSSGMDAQSVGMDGSHSTTGGDAASSSQGDGSEPLPEEDADVPTRPITRTLVYVGGYGADYPVRTFALDRKTGALSETGTPANLGNDPTYLTPSRDGRFLYVANEAGGAEGGVTVAALDANGQPSQLDHEPIVNDGFVFTSLAPNGKFVLAASYNGASVSVFPVAADGTLGSVLDTEYFSGGSQSHSIRVHPSGKWAFVPNKGADAVAQLTFDAVTGLLSPHGEAARTTDDGTGPRHFAYSQDGKLLFVIHELSSEVQSFAVGDDGTLSPSDKVSSLPEGFNGQNSGAHLLVHPTLPLLYVSNRGHNSLGVFSFDSSGALSLVEHEDARGNWPRNFDIDDAGALLVVAHQYSESLAVFGIDATGKLDPLGEVVSDVQSPAAVAIINTRD